MENLSNNIQVVCEARVNNTEKVETIKTIMNQFIEGNEFVDDRFEGKYYVIRASGGDSLQIFGEWVRQSYLLDTIRRRLLKSIRNTMTSLYFNRQAAAMGRISLVDIDDNPPNGAIMLTIIADNLEELIDIITPKTYRGRELTEAEWEKVKLQQLREQEKKKRQDQKKSKSNF
ncbi:MAG: hypothetical protein OEZ01_16555 [Candidatus Heimdallarchaeota archaeon]|nr:hypothetical protein [Candidatus Heimdallarchaeota archaeon]MDH5647624.1 hypothetical protein [Candidatus Heimdallarchaeota archaeon]